MHSHWDEHTDSFGHEIKELKELYKILVFYCLFEVYFMPASLFLYTDRQTDKPTTQNKL